MLVNGARAGYLDREMPNDPIITPAPPHQASASRPPTADSPSDQPAAPQAVAPQAAEAQPAGPRATSPQPVAPQASEPNSSARDASALGVGFAVAAFTIWGMLPLYWNLLSGVPAFEVLLHRVLWSFVLAWGLVRIGGRPVHPPLGKRRYLLAAALLLGLNWFTYVFAISIGRVVDASLGYYINPLVNVLLGMVFFRERLSPLRWVALGFATAGVVYLGIEYGAVPWVSLILAFSFGFYGVIKKSLPGLPATHGMALELRYIAPVAAALVVYGVVRGDAVFLRDSVGMSLLLAAAGVATLMPLLLFAGAAKRIPLANVGFLQYIAPTIMLVIGVLILGEPFTLQRLPGFAAVWVALLLYSISSVPRAPHGSRPGAAPARRTREGVTRAFKSEG